MILLTAKLRKKKDGSYCLTACRFEKLTGSEVFESARKLKIMMHALAKIELGVDFENMVPEEVEDTISYQELVDGKLNTNIGLGRSPLLVASALQPQVEIRDRWGRVVTKPRQKRWFDYYLDRCDDFIDSTVIFEALSRYAEKAQPLTLRRAYETIYKAASKKDRLGKKDRLLKITGVGGTELSNFTHSLSHPDMEGQNLHVKTPHSKNNFVPMSLADATKFFGQRLLKPWLINKQEIFRLADGYAKAKHLANVLGF